VRSNRISALSDILQVTLIVLAISVILGVMSGASPEAKA